MGVVIGILVIVGLVGGLAWFAAKTNDHVLATAALALAVLFVLSTAPGTWKTPIVGILVIVGLVGGSAWFAARTGKHVLAAGGLALALPLVLYITPIASALRTLPSVTDPRVTTSYRLDAECHAANVDWSACSYAGGAHQLAEDLRADGWCFGATFIDPEDVGQWQPPGPRCYTIIPKSVRSAARNEGSLD